MLHRDDGFGGLWDDSTDRMFFGLFLIFFGYWLVVDVNVTSGHGFYRDRPSKAYLRARELESAVDRFRERIGVSPNTDLNRGLMIAAIGQSEKRQTLWKSVKNWLKSTRRTPFRSMSVGSL